MELTPILSKLSYKWGYADDSGDIIIPFMFDMAHPFSNDSAVVEKDGKVGLIDKDGQYLLPPEYDYISGMRYRDGIIVRKGDKKGVVNRDNEEIIPIEYDCVMRTGTFSDLYHIHKDGKHGLFYDGGPETGLIYDDIAEISSFDETFRVKVDGKWGLIDSSFREVLPPVYERLWIFDLCLGERLALVKEESQWLFILNGSRFPADTYVVTRLKVDAYDIIRRDDGSLVLRTGYGEPLLIPIDIDDVEPFPAMGISIVRKDGKKGVINAEGSYLVPCIYDDIVGSTESNHMTVMSDGKWGLMDISGNVVVEPTFDFAYVRKDFMYVLLNGREGAVGLNQNAGVGIDCKYDRLGVFDEHGRTRACLDGKWGIIDVHDKVIEPFVHKLNYLLAQLEE